MVSLEKASAHDVHVHIKRNQNKRNNFKTAHLDLRVLSRLAGECGLRSPIAPGLMVASSSPPLLFCKSFMPTNYHVDVCNNELTAADALRVLSSDASLST